jgi:hypothetical protein
VAYILFVVEKNRSRSCRLRKCLTRVFTHVGPKVVSDRCHAMSVIFRISLLSPQGIEAVCTRSERYSYTIHINLHSFVKCQWRIGVRSERLHFCCHVRVDLARFHTGFLPQDDCIVCACYVVIQFFADLIWYKNCGNLPCLAMLFFVPQLVESA